MSTSTSSETLTEKAAPKDDAEPVVSAPAPASASAPDLSGILSKMRAAQRKAGAPTYEQRIARLDKLEGALLENKEAIAKAISEDFGNRSRHESLVAEIFVTKSLIDFTRDRLRDWMEPEEREVKWTFLPGRAEVQWQPLGVVGIISPWNYPVQLALAPLVCAIAAGNRAMIKPSELTPRTSEALAKVVAEAFAPDEVMVAVGGVDVGEAFSKLPFDHLVFTGSTRVGKTVMRAAAENLVPVTLELGGKSPAIVGEECSVGTAAEKILLGKCFNAGQTCVAPDYVLVPKGKADAFVDAAKAAVAKMYPKLRENADYTSVVNGRHYERLEGYLGDAKEKGAKVVPLASDENDPEKRRMVPTVVVDPTDDMLVMQEEIFGPILPIRTYATLDEAIDYVNDHPRPLALYWFGSDQSATDRVLERTISGGVCVNDTMLHVVQDDLPFGGVGPSGMGHYHGKEGFETLSKKKPVFYQSRLSATSMLGPPYGKLVDTFLKFMLGR